MALLDAKRLRRVGDVLPVAFELGEDGGPLEAGDAIGQGPAPASCPVPVEVADNIALGVGYRLSARTPARPAKQRRALFSRKLPLGDKNRQGEQ
jgi:hypothetical protein